LKPVSTIRPTPAPPKRGIRKSPPKRGIGNFFPRGNKGVPREELINALP